MVNYFGAVDHRRLTEEFPLGDGFLERFRRLSRDELFDRQNLRFRRVMRRAWQIPFYARRYRAAGVEPRDIRGIEEIGLLPTFSKAGSVHWAALTANMRRVTVILIADEGSDQMVSSPQQTAGAKRNHGIDVAPLTLHIGAEISGVDLTKPLPADQLKQVRDAFLKWKVVFFRGQHLDHAQHVAMARQFGEPTIGHAVFGHVGGFPEIYSVAKNRTANENRTAMMVTPWSGWHADITAAVNPPMASILRGVTIPPYGGDTFWTNLGAAYTGLSPTMRGFVNGLRGIHKFAPRESVTPGSEYNKRVERRALESEHPLVTVHAETGERVLFVSPSFLKSVVALTPGESHKLLEMLWEHVTRPEYTVRFKWNEGDIAFWDNRSTAHLAPRDIFESDFDRQLYRITLVGEPLVGVDGKPSQSIEGLPILSAAEELRMMAAE